MDEGVEDDVKVLVSDSFLLKVLADVTLTLTRVSKPVLYGSDSYFFGL